MSEHIEELMAGYILNALSPEENAELEQILRESREIADKMRELEEVMASIAHSSPRVSAPKHLRSKILKLAQEEVSQQKRLSLPFFPWSKVAIAAVVLLLLGGYAYLYQQLAATRQQLAALQADNHSIRQKLALMESNIFALQGTKVAPSASANVVLDFNKAKALLVLQNLPALPPGELYHLWAFTQKNDRLQKILCGKFNSNPSDSTLAIPIPVEDFTSPVLFMRISRESIAPNPQKKVLVMTSEMQKL